MIYFNVKSSHGVETVDELDPKKFSDYRTFRAEVSRLVGEYRMCGMPVYTSQRATKEWRESD